MIGFGSNLRQDQRQSDEGPDTKHLEKKELYEMVAKNWFIPPYLSRGVTRVYLLQVHRDQVFRVTHSEIKHFEVDLTPEHQRKVQGVGHALLLRKLNILLQLNRRKPLGFTEHDLPDQSWLHRVARYVDPTSLTEFFEVPVREEPYPNTQSSPICHIYHGRQTAAKWFLRHQNVKTNRRFWEALYSVSALYRTLMNKDLTIETLQKTLQEQVEERAEMGSTLDDLISKASLTYSAILNPALKPDAVIGGSADITPDMRAELVRHAKM